MRNTKGKSALVTGAARGIGRAIVAHRKTEGVMVAVADMALCQADFSFEGDVMNAVYCDTLPGKAAQAMNGLDILINNASIITRGPVTQATDEDYRRTMAINVEAPFQLSRAAIPIMASLNAGFVTGQVWTVDGGRMSKLSLP